jgi:flagellar motor switch/type III secretory pathway protein FliN
MNARATARTLRAAIASRGIERVTATDLPNVHAHAFTNRLYGSRGLRAGNLVWYWQRGLPSRIQEWITLVVDDVRLQLALDGDAIGLDPRQFDWRGYEGESQLLAWTACHEPLICMLRVLFQCDWLPESIGDCDFSPPRDSVQVGFSMVRADGLPIVSGVVVLDVSCVQRLLDRDALTERRLNHPMHAVRAKMALVIDELDVAPTELAVLGPGCIVRLDNRTLLAEPVRVAIPAGSLQLIADVTGVRATVVGFCSGGSGGLMSHETPTAPEAPAAQPGTPARDTSRDHGVPVGALPVRLSFSAGRLTLHFSELADVGPGYVFELDRRLDDQTIIVHANDVPIAVGELVSIGDLVGVRITRMLPGA